MEINQGVDLDNPMQQALENIPLNEPLSKRGGKIDLLLGMLVFWKIVRGIFACVSDSLVLLDTTYGKVLCGSTSEVGETVMARAMTVEELNKRFRTRLLWRGKPDFVNNYPAAKVRLGGLMRRLRKDPNVKADYILVIQEFIEQSMVGLVTSETLAQMMISSRFNSYFLPHQAVYYPGQVSTKCQVVMDASAKTATGKSVASADLACAIHPVARCNTLLQTLLLMIYFNLVTNLEVVANAKYTWRVSSNSGDPGLKTFRTHKATTVRSQHRAPSPRLLRIVQDLDRFDSLS